MGIVQIVLANPPRRPYCFSPTLCYCLYWREWHQMTPAGIRQLGGYGGGTLPGSFQIPYEMMLLDWTGCG
uniref:Uncharacterized protein n=1 Tax=Pinctada fucata TaxID=50426 RepID=A0A194ALC8_PINFU